MSLGAGIRRTYPRRGALDHRYSDEYRAGTQCLTCGELKAESALDGSKCGGVFYSAPAAPVAAAPPPPYCDNRCGRVLPERKVSTAGITIADIETGGAVCYLYAFCSDACSRAWWARTIGLLPASVSRP